MRLSSELVATLLAVYIASAAPVNDVTPPSECFLLPEIIHSFDYPFTLSILNPPLNDHQSQSWLPLRLSPPIPSPRTSSNLIISSDDSKFAPTQFQLKDSKLIARSSAAVLLPTEDISPPPLVQFVFGGDFVKTPGDDVQFFAIYACDDNNEEYLQLLADSSQGVTEDLAVESVTAGSRVYLKPLRYKGPAINLPIKINLPETT